MKKSINRQLILICFTLIIIVFMATWLINAIFLEYFYVKDSVNKLYSMYESLNSFDIDYYLSTDEGRQSKEMRDFRSSIGIACGRNNASFIVVDKNRDVVISSLDEPSEFNNMILGAFSEENEDIYKYVIRRESNYSIVNVTDPDSGIEYTVMFGNLDSGNSFMIRIALANMRDNVRTSNIFSFYVGLGAIFFGCISIFFFSNRITKPIAELTEISKRMANLDFDVKYVGKSYNEVDVLGENFNHMSETLEETIGRLKVANEELKHDVDNKTRIDNMRKEFIANVSHELKTPIALISGYAEGLKEGIIDDPENKEFYCDVIVDEADKMNKLVKQLLSLSQIEFGEEIPEMKRFNLTSLIASFVRENSVLVKDRNIAVTFENECDDIYVWSDEFQLEDVLRNYFSNALNHIDDNRMIKLSLYTKENEAFVSVFNTGANIPEESIDRIWDKFYKVDKARSREYGGSGIGLSIVKAIMTNLNGRCGVENKDNGVEFWFALPLN